MKFFVQTFGCIQNTSDSENIKNYYLVKGDEETKSWKEADVVIINTCMIRQSAENRAYGFLRNCQKLGKKIIVTGCLVGVMNKNGQKNMEVRKNFSGIEFKALDEFQTNWEPVKKFNNVVLIPISYGCNNMCSYCIVPQAKGIEVSRKMEDILVDVDKAIKEGNKNILLIGQNVNSYGSGLSDCGFVFMGKKRFKSLFPELLEKVAQKGLEKVSFVSNNPWDFSDNLIEVIAKYKNIDRLIHLPFQAGNDEILKKMNRNYSKKEYLDLVKKIKDIISDVRFSTDIIIGFPGETDEKFKETVDVCKKVGFEVAYLNKYSPRPGTVSAKLYKDDVPMKTKKERWVQLNNLINN
jgi:tRNA-2-methylthio-N6-dimethylallyladenosine synthase